MLYCSTVSLLGLFFPEGGFFCSIAGIICLPKEGLFVPFLGLFFPKEVFFVPFLGLFCSRRWFLVPLLGLFVSRRRVFCPFPRGGFCFITRTLCLPKEVFFVPLQGFFVFRRRFFCSTAGIVCLQKKVFCPLPFISRRRLFF